MDALRRLRGVALNAALLGFALILAILLARFRFSLSRGLEAALISLAAILLSFGTLLAVRAQVALHPDPRKHAVALRRRLWAAGGALLALGALGRLAIQRGLLPGLPDLLHFATGCILLLGLVAVMAGLATMVR
jgi:hypothetical protein